jgi:hypothetical protein
MSETPTEVSWTAARRDYTSYRNRIRAAFGPRDRMPSWRRAKRSRRWRWHYMMSGRGRRAENKP